ncbi:Zinc finger BED domain-containing protein RICESLEEPER 1, partial [Linum perenne]
EATKGRTAGKVSSQWWQFCDKVVIDKKKKATCKFCKRLIIGDPKKDISHLKKHYQRCPKRQFPDLNEQLLQSKADKDNFQITPFNFEQKNSRQVLAKAIIKHEYPLCMVDHESFREFYNSLYPCFKLAETQ